MNTPVIPAKADGAAKVDALERAAHVEVTCPEVDYLEAIETSKAARADLLAHNTAKDAEIARLRAANAGLLAALEEIAKGKGEFSRDQLIHASNTINAMKELARDAITVAHPVQGDLNNAT